MYRIWRTKEITEKTKQEYMIQPIIQYKLPYNVKATRENNSHSRNELATETHMELQENRDTRLFSEYMLCIQTNHAVWPKQSR